MLRACGNYEDLRTQLAGINPQPRPQRHRRQQTERVPRPAAHARDERRGAAQDLNQGQPGGHRIGSMLARWQRLRLTGRGDERLGQQQLRTVALPGSGPPRVGRPRGGPRIPRPHGPASSRLVPAPPSGCGCHPASPAPSQNHHRRHRPKPVPLTSSPERQMRELFVQDCVHKYSGRAAAGIGHGKLAFGASTVARLGPGTAASWLMSAANSPKDRLCSASDSAFSGAGWTSISRP